MQTKKFRSVPTDGFPAGVFEAPTNPMIVVSTLESTYHNTIESKNIYLDVLKNNPNAFEQGQLMILFVWQGKFRSDVFEIKLEDLPKFNIYIAAATAPYA